MLPTLPLQRWSQAVTAAVLPGQAIAYSGAIAASGSQPHGVARMTVTGTVAAPATCTIDTAGYTQGLAGGPIAVGAGVAIGANGRFVSSTTNIFGRAVSAAGADGDEFQLHITREG